jgi:plasmid stabilization system protein ParE
MTRRVTMLRRAQDDVDDIHRWIDQRSPDGAERWLAAFESAVARIQRAPLSCGLAPESGRFPSDVREVFFKTRRGRTYRLLFTVMGGEIRVLRVRGPGQRPVTRRDLMPKGRACPAVILRSIARWERSTVPQQRRGAGIHFASTIQFSATDPTAQETPRHPLGSRLRIPTGGRY